MGGQARKPPTQRILNPSLFIELHRPLFDRASVRRKLVYYDYQIARIGTAGVITNYFFSANGCFDPNITGTGHQPLGFDELIAWYEQYTVMESTAQVTWVNNGANVCNVGIGLTPDTTAASIPSCVENGYVEFTAIDAAAGLSGAGSGNRITKQTLSCDSASYFGRKTFQEMINDATLSGTAGANPAEQVYFDLMTWDGFFGSGDTTCAANLVIVYDVVFWEPRQHAAEFKSSENQLRSKILPQPTPGAKEVQKPSRFR